MKKQTIYLHIGAHKTGTTSLQAFLLENAPAFREQGYYVPSPLIGNTINGHIELPASLIRDFSDFWHETWPKLARGDSGRIWESTIRQIKESGCDMAILSSEVFVDITHKEGRHASSEMGERICHYLADFDVRVIAYVRPVDEYLNSLYRQSIKSTAETRSYGEIASGERNQERSFTLHPTVFLDFYSGLFGKDAILVKKYDRHSFPSGNIVEDFMATIGVQSDLLRGHAASMKEWNQSVPEVDIDFKRAFNAAGIGDASINSDISNILLKAGRHVRKQTTLEPNFWEALSGEIAAEHRALKERYGVELAATTEIADMASSSLTISDSFQIGLAAWSIGHAKQISCRLDDVLRMQVNGILQPYIRQSCRAIGYATGAHAKWLMSNTMLPCLDIVAWADQDQSKHGESFFGTTVIAPPEIPERNPEVVFITSPDYGVEIWKDLNRMLPAKTEIVVLF